MASAKMSSTMQCQDKCAKVKGVPKLSPMWPGVIASFPGTNASYAIKHNRLGDILNYAKSYLLVAHGTNSGVKDHFEIYHVVGDPTLQLWAEEPAPIRLSASIRSNNLNIHVNPAPADGVVTIWYLGKQVKRIALSSTRISIPVSDLRLTPSRFPAFCRGLRLGSGAQVCPHPGQTLGQKWEATLFGDIWPNL